ncbi:hypothetical protein JYT28_00310 [Desulfobulbus sp. AH-315-M07]|nr:hypothetical protein [Desulfobulbus sp. AH-315-M07]
MRVTWLVQVSMLAAVSGLAFACSSDNSLTFGNGDGGSSSSSADGVTSGSSSGTPQGVGGGADQGPFFETDIIPIFENSCGTNDDMCHTKNAFAAAADAGCIGWLSLENIPLGSVTPNGTPTGCPDMDLYERLMLRSWQCDDENGARYVVPCDPDNSYLVHKTDGGPLCNLSGPNGPMVSELMPIGAQMDAAEAAIIRSWIANGAKRIDGSGTDCNPGSGGSGAGGSGAGGSGPASTGSGMPAQNPVPEIYHPVDGQPATAGLPLLFKGVANDPQDGVLPGSSLDWWSSVDGYLGAGDNFEVPLTTTGQHTIELVATDSDNNKGWVTVVVNVQ